MCSGLQMNSYGGLGASRGGMQSLMNPFPSSYGNSCKTHGREGGREGGERERERERERETLLNADF